MTNNLTRRIAAMVVAIASLGFALLTPVGFVSAQNDDVVGTQTDEPNLNGGVNELIVCLGNTLLPPTVCAGTESSDKMIGQGPERIYGLDGDDIIQAEGGNDIVYAGDGDDTVQGGEGSDVLFGQDGKDILIGDSGTNIIFGGGGNTLYGGAGDDKLYGQSDNDVFIGGSGHDFFDCNEGGDTIVDFDPKEDTANANCENGPPSKPSD